MGFFLRKIGIVGAIVPALLLSTPGMVAAAQGDDAADAATLRITTIEFIGWARPVPAGAGEPAHVEGHSTICNVVGVYRTVPFISPCEFDFSTNAAVSVKCSGVFVHVSTLSFPLPFGESLSINYEPTVTKIVEGEGSGNGVNQAHLGKVHFDIVSLCAVSQDGEGNMVGYATAL